MRSTQCAKNLALLISLSRIRPTRMSSCDEFLVAKARCSNDFRVVSVSLLRHRTQTKQQDRKATTLPADITEIQNSERSKTLAGIEISHELILPASKLYAPRNRAEFAAQIENGKRFGIPSRSAFRAQLSDR
jgi:hypothetical protein